MKRTQRERCTAVDDDAGIVLCPLLPTQVNELRPAPGLVLEATDTDRNLVILTTVTFAVVRELLRFDLRLRFKLDASLVAFLHKLHRDATRNISA